VVDSALFSLVEAGYKISKVKGFKAADSDLREYQLEKNGVRCAPAVGNRGRGELHDSGEPRADSAQ